MDRLYLRITLGVLVILVLAFSLPVVIFRVVGRNGPRPETAGLMSGSAELLKDRLEHVPPNQMERELDSLRAIFAYPLQLTDTSDESLPDQLPEAGIIRTVVSTGLVKPPSHHLCAAGELRQGAGDGTGGRLTTSQLVVNCHTGIGRPDNCRRHRLYDDCASDPQPEKTATGHFTIRRRQFG